MEIIEASHAAGLRSTVTVMFGHVEEPWELAEHMRVVRALQERTGGFTEFVPLSFIPFHTLLGRTHGVEEISREENLKHTAAFRLALGRSVPNLQASWVKMGLDAATEALRWGVNDLGGTLMEESISRMAGSYHGVRLDPGGPHRRRPPRRPARGRAHDALRDPPASPARRPRTRAHLTSRRLRRRGGRYPLDTGRRAGTIAAQRVPSPGVGAGRVTVDVRGDARWLPAGCRRGVQERLDGRRRGTGAGVVAPTAAPAQAARGTTGPLTPIVAAEVPQRAIAPVRGTDGRYHVLYELQLTNTLEGAADLRSVRVIDPHSHRSLLKPVPAGMRARTPGHRGAWPCSRPTPRSAACSTPRARPSTGPGTTGRAADGPPSGSVLARVGKKFSQLGFIEYNGHLEVHSSLLSVVLNEQASTVRQAAVTSR